MSGGERPRIPAAGASDLQPEPLDERGASARPGHAVLTTVLGGPYATGVTPTPAPRHDWP